MGGNNNRQKKSSSPCALLSYIFKAKPKTSSRKGDQDSSGDAESVKYSKVWPSDEDRGWWVADPRIDSKATAYIAKILAAARSAD
ncbi:hypothetical protein Acr_10g0000130 [Actinidia rufa]|uniref:Uncharacterized protein n=1 Tax=Actinidia rufa TaxID=165716 RepID=A0A7J0F7F2_9ERIC|nr:hypothetical protein Acr_10g0000130 [Actinidia rufa]